MAIRNIENVPTEQLAEIRRQAEHELDVRHWLDVFTGSPDHVTAAVHQRRADKAQGKPTDHSPYYVALARFEAHGG